MWICVICLDIVLGIPTAKAEAEKVSVFLRLSSHDFPVKRSGGETDIHMQGIAPTPLHTCRHSAYPLPHSAQVFFKKSEWARGGRGVGKRKVGREVGSRGSRGGYPLRLAALGSEDWCDAVHTGVFSHGRPVRGVAPPTAPATRPRGRNKNFTTKLTRKATTT